MSKGMTLIEILVVILILSLFVVVGVSGVLMQREKFEASGEINELLADLRYAKQMSITEQAHYGMVFNFEDNSYQVFREGEVIKEKFFGLELEAVENYTEVKFTRFGAVFKGGEVLIKSDNILRVIEIKPSGFFHVQRININ